MKTSKSLWFICLLNFLILGYGIAQPSNQYAFAKSDSAKAYWTLRATQTDQTPTVQFYTAHHELLYQETLPAKARHIDRQTKRALDKLLTNLANNRILTSTYLNEESRDEAPYLPTYRLATEQSLHQMIFRKGGRCYVGRTDLGSIWQIIGKMRSVRQSMAYGIVRR